MTFFLAYNYSDILLGIVSGIYSDILSGIYSAIISDILFWHLRSGARGLAPAVPEKDKHEEKATLINLYSIDTHLAGGEQGVLSR